MKVTTSPPNLGGLSHLDVRLPPATGSASTSLASPARKMDSASALRSRSSRYCRIVHCFQLVSYTKNSSTILSGLRKASRSRLGSMRNLPNSIELYRLATAGPVVSASRTSPRKLGVRLSSMQWFVRYHTGKCQAIGPRPFRSSFKSSLDRRQKNVELPSQQNLQPSNAQWYDHSGTSTTAYEFVLPPKGDGSSRSTRS